MKKTLIALAVMAASSASMAQVTLYGVVDVALGATSATGVKSDASMKGNDIFNDGNSRWGFKAVEDLGGGMKFTGQFEQNLNYENGAATTTSSRYAYGSLSGGFGTVKYGRTLTPSFFGVAAWELTGAANFSAVANQFGFAGGGSRNDSEFSYTTPKMGGLSASLGYVTELDGIAQGFLGSKFDMNVVYSAGPLSAALSYWKNDKVAAGASTDGNYALGANYNFGAFSVAGSFQDAAGKSQGWTLGASMPMGPWKFTVDVAQDTGFDDTNYVLYAGYSLSKRTTVYGQYHNDGKSGDAVKKTATTSETYGVGVRHNF
jgi:predicted porin